MSSTNRISGWIRLIVGGLGVAVCLAGLVATWVVHNRLQSVVQTTFERVDTALTGLEDRTQYINEEIVGAHDSLGALDDRVQQRMADIQDRPVEKAADIDQLERQLYARVRRVSAWVDFAFTSAELIHQLLEMAESFSGFRQQESHTAREMLAATRSLREEVGELQSQITQLEESLVELRASRDIEANAARVKTISGRIDGTLTKIEDLGNRFETALGRLQEKCDQLHTRIRRRLTVIAGVISLALLWMAWGQFSLAATGRRRLKKTAVDIQ